MLAFDTNLAVHAVNQSSPWQARAANFLQSLATRRDVAVGELMLVELYLKLRNEKIFPRPLNAPQAAAVVQAYRQNRAWTLIESAEVMDDVWRQAAHPGFAFRRLVDLRLALTLQRHGVLEFATTNLKDFADVGFQRLWNPLAE